jgi:hypothetical protein
MRFHLRAASAAGVSSATLYLQPEGGAVLEWPVDNLVPAAEVDLIAELNLVLNPLPAFAPITYWWSVADGAGAAVTTAPITFRYEDNRFTWGRIATGSLTVHWYSGGPALGQAALDTAINALPRINRDIRAPLPARLDIYVYADAADLQTALRRLGLVWAGGHADPALGVILVAVPPDLRADFNLQRDLPHELTHLLLAETLGAHAASLPAWLNEGLAVMNQGQRDSQYPALLAAARDARAFLPLAGLCRAFPDDAVQARLAYAQSEAFVRYLRERFGSEGLHQLILTYAAGVDCEAGVQTALGQSLGTLEADWLRDTIYSPPPGTLTNLAPWLVITALVTLAPLTFFALIARRGRPTSPRR